MNDFTKEILKEDNLNWLEIPVHPYKILIIVGSGLRKTNSLFNLIGCQPNIGETFLYPKDPYEAKYQLLIKKRKGANLRHCNGFEAFIEYSSNMDDVYKNIEEYNLGKEFKNFNCIWWYDCWYA